MVGLLFAMMQIGYPEFEVTELSVTQETWSKLVDELGDKVQYVTIGFATTAIKINSPYGSVYVKLGR